MRHFMTSRKVETMTRINRLSLRNGAFAALVTLLAGLHAAAQPCPAPVPKVPDVPMTVGWAAGARGNQTPNGPAENLALAPDGKCTFVSGSSWLVTGTFNQQVTCPSLAARLGVSAKELKSYDLIAFEGNSQSAEFENSIWFVTDNVASAHGMFLGDAKSANAVPVQQLKFRAGKMCAADYMDIFHVKEFKDSKGNSVSWVGWILVDIPDTAKMDPKTLKLFLTGVRNGTVSKLEGSPDPDAVGLIVH